jgi:hypothetical protein
LGQLSKNHKPSPALDALPFDHRGVVREIALRTQNRMRLTEMAWEEVQAADAAQLRFLAEMSGIDDPGLEFSQARVAIFESEAIRQFTMSAWSRATDARRSLPPTARPAL